jgi:2'-5' RNA ligase
VKYKLSKPDHEFSSTQVDLEKVVADKVRSLGSKIPDSDLAEDGREADPHITVKFGLHDDEPSAELKRIVKDHGPIQAKLGKTSLFSNDEADVVKIDVVSHDLHRLNKKISGACKCTDTHPEYQPHATVAYVKPGKGKKYSGNASLEGTPVTFDHVVFSTKDRTAIKLPLGKYSFRK